MGVKSHIEHLGDSGQYTLEGGPSQVCTLGWRAPETEKVKGQHGASANIYSVGLTLHTLFVGPIVEADLNNYGDIDVFYEARQDDAYRQDGVEPNEKRKASLARLATKFRKKLHRTIEDWEKVTEKTIPLYGPVPGERMWGELAMDAYKRRSFTVMEGQEKQMLLQKHYIATRGGKDKDMDCNQDITPWQFQSASLRSLRGYGNQIEI